MSDTKIPEWPDIAQYSVPGGFANGPKHGERGVALIRWGYSQLQEEVTYERARADAAMARLRVAVEALKHQVAMVGGCDCHESYLCRNLTDPTCVYHNYELEDAKAALALIGPLPEQP